MKSFLQGWVIALLETPNSFGDEGLEKVIEVAKRTSFVVGGWKERKFYYYNADEIFDNKEDAIQKGRLNEQITIYTIETATLIYLLRKGIRLPSLLKKP